MYVYIYIYIYIGAPLPAHDVPDDGQLHHIYIYIS